MSDANTTREPPELILVPPGTGPRSWIVLLFVAVPLLVVTGLILLLPPLGGARMIVGTIMGTCNIGVLTLVVLLNRRRSARLARNRREFLERHPNVLADPRAQRLAATWREGRRPNIENVRAALAEHGCDDRACIVCFGEPELTDVGDLHFEPEIITALEYVWRQLVWVPLVAGLVAWWLLDYVNWLPPWFPSVGPFMSSFSYFYVAAAIGVGLWIWRAVIRPTYIRMAPGIIQVLVYRLRRGKPQIRSYPMEPGTLAIILRVQKHTMLHLARGDQRDLLPFPAMRRSRQRVKRAWEALLSTAPIPPLSDEELVG